MTEEELVEAQRHYHYDVRPAYSLYLPKKQYIRYNQEVQVQVQVQSGSTGTGSTTMTERLRNSPVIQVQVPVR